MEKDQNPQLERDISADAANLIAGLVAILPESISKSRISSVNQTDASDAAESIYRNGKVYTGYYKKFHALSQANRDKVMAACECQGIKKGPQKKTGRQVSFAKTTEKELGDVTRFQRFRVRLLSRVTIIETSAKTSSGFHVPDRTNTYTIGSIVSTYIYIFSVCIQ